MKIRYVVLIGMVLLLLTISVGHNTPANAILEQAPDRKTHAEFTPHGQINIDSNAGFTAWPGEGTAEEPYVISGINITMDTYCVYIITTNVHFIIKDSFFYYTGPSAIPAVGIYGANNSRIENCTLKAGWMSIANNLSYNSTITGNRMTGGITTDSPNVTITQNTISLEGTHGAEGIRVNEYATSAMIYNNSIDGYGSEEYTHGVEVLEAQNVTIEENSILNTPYAGIYFSEATSGVVTRNTIISCGTGIRAYNTPLLELQDNLIKDGTYGILILGNNCTVVGNSVFRNDGPGVTADGYNSTLYGNFIGFNQDGWQGFENTGTNFWDDGISAGNYWSDYDGEGTYAVTGGAIDHYPQAFIESTITHPVDMIVEIETPESITWSSNGTLPESYVLTVNGELDESDSWDGAILSFDLGDLVAGVFEVELTTHFSSRMSVSDSVTVTVESASGPTIVLAQVSGLAGETVEVSAEISDISGVFEVVLSYSVDGSTWTNVTMSESGAQWNGTIPGQAIDTVVEYKVYAWDSLGNLAVSDTKSYTTQADPAPPPMTLLLIAGAGVAGVVVVGLVVLKRR